MGKWIVLKVFSSSENQSMKTGCICVRSFRRTPSRLLVLCSLVWPWLPTSVFMSHMQQSSLADTAKTLLWGCYGFLCTRFLLQPSVRKCPIKLRVFFFRNLQISHLTHWVRIANVFTWLEILSSMWGLRIPQRQDLHAFTSTTVLKLSSVTWAVTKPWGLCVCVDPSVHLQHTPLHALWPNRFSCQAGKWPLLWAELPQCKHCSDPTHLLNSTPAGKFSTGIRNLNYFRL